MANGYDAWGERYAATFGLRSEEDARSIAAWTELFCRSGVTVAELNSATDWLALNNPPRWPSEHLAAIRECVDRFRRQQRDRRPDMPPDLGECVLCHNGGMVSVPSLRAMELGKWGTQAVICRCALGRWVGERQCGDGANGEPRPPLMSLEEYERRCPDWRGLLAAKNQEVERNLRRKYVRGPCSAELDKVMDSLVDSFRLRSTG